MKSKLSNNNGLSESEINHFLKNINTFGGCFAKDQIPKKLKEGYFYIINMQNSTDGNGTHWVCFQFNKSNIIYMDSFGVEPPLDIIKLAKKINIYDELKSKSPVVIYNPRQIQDFNSTACGYFCIAFILFMIGNKEIVSKRHNLTKFIKYFDKNTNKNDDKLFKLIYMLYKKIGFI